MDNLTSTADPLKASSPFPAMDLLAASKILINHDQIEAAKEAEQRLLSHRTWYRPDLISYTAPQPTKKASNHTGSTPCSPGPSSATAHAPNASPYRVEEEGLERDEKLRRKALRVAERLRSTALLRLAVTEASFVTRALCGSELGCYADVCKREAVRTASADLDELQRRHSRETAGDYRGGGGGGVVAPCDRMVELQKTIDLLTADMEVSRTVADAARVVIAGDPTSRGKAAAALNGFDDVAVIERGVWSGRLVPQEVCFKTKSQMEELFQGYLRQACVKHVKRNSEVDQ